MYTLTNRHFTQSFICAETFLCINCTMANYTKQPNFICTICYPFRKPLETFENAILLYCTKVFVYYAQNNLLKFLILCAIYHYTSRVFYATIPTESNKGGLPHEKAGL